MKIATFLFLAVACFVSIVAVLLDSIALLYISPVCAGFALVLFALLTREKPPVMEHGFDAVTVAQNRTEELNAKEELQSAQSELIGRLHQTEKELAEKTNRLDVARKTALEVWGAVRIIREELRDRKAAALESDQAGMPFQTDLPSMISEIDEMVTLMSSASIHRRDMNHDTGENSSQKAVGRGAFEDKKLKSLAALTGDLSEQSNVLAINAAIEAARAGVAGRGFAIIAHEIQVLSTKIDSSATEMNNVYDMARKASLAKTAADQAIRREADGYRISVSEVSRALERATGKLSDLRSRLCELISEREAMPLSGTMEHADDVMGKFGVIEDSLTSLLGKGIETEITS